MNKHIIKNIEAKKSIIGSLLLVVMLISVSLTALFILLPEIVKADDYTDYASVKEITIESDYISSSLTNFPILVHDNTGDLTVCKANGSDIGFWNESNATKFNHEIEYYNSTTGELFVWVNITSISSATDTTFYMYYEDSDSDNPVNHNPQDVWDSDYLFVCHMNDTTASQLYNSIDGTSSTVKNCTEIEDGDIGYAQWFDNTSAGTEVDWGDICDIGTNDMTTLAWANSSDVTQGSHQRIWTKRADADNNMYFNGHCNDYGYGVALLLRDGAAWDTIGRIETGSDFTNDVYYLVGGLADRGTSAQCFINDSGPYGTDDAHGSASIDIGPDFCVGGNPTQHSSWWYGYIDEIRVSDVIRNEAWVNATFHSLNQTTGFVTLGASVGTSVSLSGLTSGTFTWQGEQGETVWSNSSGTNNETGVFNITIEGVDVCEYIRINISDLDTNITASNITLLMSANNSTWTNFGAFSDGALNTKTLNTTTWSAIDAGEDPFPINYNTELYMRLQLTIPSGIGNETYSVASTTWQWDAGSYS